MRFLITCLTLFCFQSFVVCTREDGAITFAQKTITAANYNKDSSILIAKKVITESVKQSTFEVVDRIYQNLNHVFVISFFNCKAYLIPTLLKSINFYSDNTNHSYLFIFSCLYPKHTFW